MVWLFPIDMVKEDLHGDLYTGSLTTKSATEQFIIKHTGIREIICLTVFFLIVFF